MNIVAKMNEMLRLVGIELSKLVSHTAFCMFCILLSA